MPSLRDGVVALRKALVAPELHGMPFWRSVSFTTVARVLSLGVLWFVAQESLSATTTDTEVELISDTCAVRRTCHNYNNGEPAKWTGISKRTWSGIMSSAINGTEADFTYLAGGSLWESPVLTPPTFGRIQTTGRSPSSCECGVEPQPAWDYRTDRTNDPRLAGTNVPIAERFWMNCTCYCFDEYDVCSQADDAAHGCTQHPTPPPFFEVTKAPTPAPPPQQSYEVPCYSKKGGPAVEKMLRNSSFAVCDPVTNITYTSSCVAECDGVSSYTSGPCNMDFNYLRGHMYGSASSSDASVEVTTLGLSDCLCGVFDAITGSNTVQCLDNWANLDATGAPLPYTFYANSTAPPACTTCSACVSLPDCEYDFQGILQLQRVNTMSGNPSGNSFSSYRSQWTDSSRGPRRREFTLYEVDADPKWTCRSIGTLPPGDSQLATSCGSATWCGSYGCDPSSASPPTDPTIWSIQTGLSAICTRTVETPLFSTLDAYGIAAGWAEIVYLLLIWLSSLIVHLMGGKLGATECCGINCDTADEDDLCESKPKETRKAQDTWTNPTFAHQTDGATAHSNGSPDTTDTKQATNDTSTSKGDGYLYVSTTGGQCEI